MDLILMGEVVQADKQVIIALTLIVGTGSQLMVDAIELLLQAHKGREGLISLLQNGTASDKVNILLEVANLCISLQSNGTRIRR